jgi:hypothetical protein
LKTDRPAILAMNLGQTDQIAHTGDWPGYLHALWVADSLVFDLWTKIQADTALAGKTALIVTNDHGRHDDAHGGFQNHGDGCTGCRTVQLLALGPDFRTGYVSAASVRQIDIAPTCGALLGIPTPYAAGVVMDSLLVVPHTLVGVEALVPPAALRLTTPAPNPSRSVVSLSLDVPGAGVLVVDVLDAQGRRVAVLERGPAGPGRRAIVWTGTTDRGQRAPAGIYFVRARMNGRQTAARVVLR